MGRDYRDDCSLRHDCLRHKLVHAHGDHYQASTGGVPNVLAQIGNYGNFVAYLVMGIPQVLISNSVTKNGTHRSRHR